MTGALAEWPRGLKAERVLVLAPGDHAWRLSWVTRQGRGLKVESAGRMADTPAAGEAGATGVDPIEGSGAAGTWVVLGLPATEVVARRLETPFSDADKARQVLPSLLDGHLPFALEKCLYSFVDPRRNAAGHHTALAVAARRDEVERQLDVCRDRRDLHPAVVDGQALALWRQALRELPPASGAARVIAHVDGEHLTLVLGRGADWHDALTFKTAGADRGAGPEERADLVRRVQRRWRSLPPEWANGPAEWIWCGPSASETLLRTLGGLLAPPGASSRLAPDSATLLERALAAPLLLEGAPALNLLPADRAPASLRRALDARARRTALVWIAAALLPVLAALAWRARVEQRGALFLNRALAAYEELAGAPCPQPGLVQILAPRALEERRAALRPFLLASEPPRSETLRVVLRAVHEKGLAVQNLEWSGTTVRLHGPAVSANDAEALCGVLGAAGLAATPEPGVGGHWQVKVEVAP